MERGKRVCINCPGHMTKMAYVPISLGRPEIFEKVAKIRVGAYLALTSLQIDSPLKVLSQIIADLIY